MSRRRSSTAFESKLHAVVSRQITDLVSAIVTAVRQNIADELAVFAGASARPPLRRTPTPQPRDMACLAPGCRTPSRGPRFRYLCPKHERASEKKVEAWKAKRRAEKRQGRGAKSGSGQTPQVNGASMAASSA